MIDIVNLMPTYRCNLDCDFCFAKDMQKIYPNDITIEDLHKLLDWFDAQKLKRFSLLGGEPTIHPRFIEILDILKKRNFSVTLFSNALFSEDVAEAIIKAGLRGLVVTYNPEKFYTEQQYKILNRNLDFLRQHNVVFKPSFNVCMDNLDYGYIIDLCKKYNLGHVRIAFASPNDFVTNQYLDWENLQKAATVVYNAVRDLHKMRIKCTLDGCVVPLCIFTTKQRIFLQNALAPLETVCYGVFDINPDLSVCICLPLSSVKLDDITKYSNLKEVGDKLLKMVEDLMWKEYLIDECEDCRYWHRKICIGGSCKLKEVLITQREKQKVK